MSFHSLPVIAEARFAEYLTSKYTGSYPIQRAFDISLIQYPGIFVSAGQFRELEPGTHVYEAKLSVGIVTQIDDTEAPLVEHDQTTATIYDLLADQSALFETVNTPGGNFNLWGMFQDSYDQSKEERELMTVITFNITCQTLEVT